MKVSKKSTSTHPFVLTASELQKFSNYFDDTHKIIIKASTSDGLVREFESISEFINYENPINSTILGMGINVHAKDWERKAFINFWAAFPRNNISITLNGEEDEVLAIGRFFEERLESLRPWYGFMATLSWKSMLVDILIVLAIFSPLQVLLTKIPITSSYMRIGLIIFLALTVNSLWGYIKRKLFPPGVFAIGQGEARHNHYDKYRELFIFGMVIEIIGGIITNAMFN